MFHRVLPQNLISEPNAYITYGTLISQDYLQEVLSLIISFGFQFAKVSELATKSEEKNLIALTFDDGYSDNFEFALPVLQTYNASATFFPTVEPCMTQTVLPLDIYYQCVDELKIIAQERQDLIFGETKKRFYWADPIQQLSLITELFSNLPDKTRVSYMNSHQLKLLSDYGFEIGSHGMTHSILIAEYMTEHKIIEELYNSKRWLEGITGKPVTTFCFPAGRYNSKVMELAKQVGYTSTCLVIRNDNEKDIIPSFERIFVRPNSIEELKSAISIQ